MRSFTLLSVLSLASLVLATPDLAHRRHHRDLSERQRPNMNNSWSEPPLSSSTTIISSASPSPSSSSSSTSASSASTTIQQTTQSTTAPPPASSSSATAAPTSSEAPAVSSVAPTTSQPAVVSSVSSEVAVSNSGVPTISVPSSSSASISQPTVINQPSTLIRSSVTLVTTATRTASSTSSATAAAAESGTSSGGLSKTALIAIIVVSSVVGAAAIAFTLFRKYKLRPSKRFERKLNAIDFSPKGGVGDDDFYEKTHNRSASASSAERHRKALMEEEFESGGTHVAGVPEHDFTAGTAYGMAGAGAGAAGVAAGGYGMYNSDPFAHTQAYDYSYVNGDHGYPPQSYDQYGNPMPLVSSLQQGGYNDYPTQDQDHDQVDRLGQDHSAGYADLQRGNSSGSGHAHTQRVLSPTNMSNSGHGHGNAQMYTDDFPESGAYLGRPTGGADGPYAQAAQYRY